MAEAVIEPPGSRDAESLAEWVEMTLLLGDGGAITRLAIRQRFTIGQQPDDVELGLLFAEIRRRRDVASALYPFDVGEDENAIVRRQDVDATVYDFLLMLSLEKGPYRQQDRYNDANPAFELLARQALRTHLGSGAAAVRFAWPRSDGRPEPFADAVSWLAVRMGLGELNGSRNPDKKDGAVDVVGWRRFADPRPAFPIVLAQVTVEMTFDEKAGRIPLAQWKTWIDFGADPATALVIPFAVPLADERWETVRFREQLVLDRLRLCELLAHDDLTGYPEWLEMRSFVTREIELLAEPAILDKTPHIARPKKPVVAAHKAAYARRKEASETDRQTRGRR